MTYAMSMSTVGFAELNDNEIMLVDGGSIDWGAAAKNLEKALTGVGACITIAAGGVAVIVGVGVAIGTGGAAAIPGGELASAGVVAISAGAQTLAKLY